MDFNGKKKEEERSMLITTMGAHFRDAFIIVKEGMHNLCLYNYWCKTNQYTIITKAKLLNSQSLTKQSNS